MKRLRFITVLILLGSLTIQADPIKTWSWTAPTEYENNISIPGGDLTAFALHCGMTQGGPYPATKIFTMQTPPSIEDMDFVVAGLPGTYYCVATVSSLAHFTMSGYSNEINFTVVPGDLGFVPKPPVLSLE